MHLNITPIIIYGRTADRKRCSYGEISRFEPFRTLIRQQVTLFCVILITQ